MGRFYIGTAEWSVPAASRHLFPDDGTHLERYARVFNAVEINSSFYRQHSGKTFLSWASSVPKDFRFSVKLSKTLTHDAHLKAKSAAITECLRPILELKEKLGVLLVQLPPKLSFEERIALQFFAHVRSLYSGMIAVEPRNISWTLPNAARLFKTLRLTRVMADPDRLNEQWTISPGIKIGALYLRLHGAPEIYKSSYSRKALENFTLVARQRLRARSGSAWCIFDNTTFGHATRNALTMQTISSTKS